MGLLGGQSKSGVSTAGGGSASTPGASGGFNAGGAPAVGGGFTAGTNNFYNTMTQRSIPGMTPGYTGQGGTFTNQGQPGANAGGVNNVFAQYGGGYASGGSFIPGMGRSNALNSNISMFGGNTQQRTLGPWGMDETTQKTRENSLANARLSPVYGAAAGSPTATPAPATTSAPVNRSGAVNATDTNTSSGVMDEDSQRLQDSATRYLNPAQSYGPSSGYGGSIFTQADFNSKYGPGAVSYTPPYPVKPR